MSWKGMLVLAGAALIAASLAAAASAGKPDTQRIEVDDSGPDEFLTGACGFPVVTTFEGHVIVRTFEDDGKGLVSLTTLVVRAAAQANGNVVRIMDVGADQLRIAPDGTVILSIIGQIPFGPGFTGVLKLNLSTGEAILEPHHFTEDVAGVCSALAA